MNMVQVPRLRGNGFPTRRRKSTGRWRKAVKLLLPRPEISGQIGHSPSRGQTRSDDHKSQKGAKSSTLVVDKTLSLEVYSTRFCVDVFEQMIPSVISLTDRAMRLS